MNIAYLDYKGEKLPFRISYYALKHFEAETGNSIASLSDKMENMEILIFYALEAGHKADGKTFGIKREEMEFILDECYAQFKNEMSTFFPAPTQLITTEENGKKKE
jgi:hypothetical protein